VDRRHVESRWVFREGDSVAPPAGEPTDFVRRFVHVEERQDATRDEPIGITGAPFVDVPVVVRPDHDLVHSRIWALVQHLTREAGPIGKVETRERASGRHITYSFVHVVTARPHFAVARRVDVEHLWRFAGDGVQPEVATLLVAIPPLLESMLVRFDPGRQVSVLCGNVTLEHVGGFRDVIVHADEDHVICLHRRPLGSRHATKRARRKYPYYIQSLMRLPLSRNLCSTATPRAFNDCTRWGSGRNGT